MNLLIDHLLIGHSMISMINGIFLNKLCLKLTFKSGFEFFRIRWEPDCDEFESRRDPKDARRPGDSPESVEPEPDEPDDTARSNAIGTSTAAEKLSFWRTASISINTSKNQKGD